MVVVCVVGCGVLGSRIAGELAMCGHRVGCTCTVIVLYLHYTYTVPALHCTCTIPALYLHYTYTVPALH